jgi:hypothetical protein
VDDIHISELKIGDTVYYKADKEDIKDVNESMNNIGFGSVSGGLNEPNSYYWITPLGNYLDRVITMMDNSMNKKLKVKIISLNPLKVEPLLIYQRGINDGDVFCFPRFIIGRLYDDKGKIIEYN